MGIPLPVCSFVPQSHYIMFSCSRCVFKHIAGVKCLFKAAALTAEPSPWQPSPQAEKDHEVRLKALAKSRKTKPVSNYLDFIVFDFSETTWSIHWSFQTQGCWPLYLFKTATRAYSNHNKLENSLQRQPWSFYLISQTVKKSHQDSHLFNRKQQKFMSTLQSKYLWTQFLCLINVIDV